MQSDVMLDNIRQQFIRLISAYEREESERVRLEKENGRLVAQCDAYGKQIAELEKKIQSRRGKLTVSSRRLTGASD